MMGRKAIIVLPLLLILIVVGAGISWINGYFPGSGSPIGLIDLVENNSSKEIENDLAGQNSTRQSEQEKLGPATYRIEEVATGLEVPWSIVFTSVDRILFTERLGRVRAIEDGKLLEKSLVEFPEVSQRSEDGLMEWPWIPIMKNNKYVYVSLLTIRQEERF
jgi:glucose/arabinose dehydrogenase